MYTNFYNYQRNGNQPEIREKLERYGIDIMSVQELVMLILGSGIKNYPVEKISQKVAYEIMSKSPEKLFTRLQKIKGVGKSKASLICAAVELGKRIFNSTKCKISSPEDLIPLVKHYTLEKVEYFIAVALNGSNEIIDIREICKGASNKAVIQPREVFSELLCKNAAAVIFVHNHPSGNTEPSPADIEITKRLIKGSEILGIKTLDHIIIGIEDYFSFTTEGIIKELIE